MKISCQLMAKECTLQSLVGFPRNTVVRITDRPGMTSVVYRGRKISIQANKQTKYLGIIRVASLQMACIV